MRLWTAIVLLCAGLAGLSASAGAHQYRLGPLLIVHPRAVSLIAGRPVAVYISVVNRSDSLDRIVAVSSPRARMGELHEHVMAGDVMMMKQVESIEVPAHGKAEFKPGGYHIMLFDVAGPLKPGDRLAVELAFEFAGHANIEAIVTKPGTVDMDMSGAAMEDHTQ